MAALPRAAGRRAAPASDAGIGSREGAPPDVSVVLVHYRAGRLAAEALAAAAADLAAAGLAAELVVVDNGSDPGDRAHLAPLPARHLDPGENLGFAGGVNLGVAATSGRAIVLMNPDVTVRRGCLPALLAELDAGAGIAGPCFWWDAGRRLLLPPTEARSLADELLASLALAGGGWERRARARWRRHARRHWTAERPLASHALSGALLAVRRDAWDRVGPFDPAYRLYFEETDWLVRARRAGVAARYVPAAEAIHAHGASTRHEPRAAEWFADSARRFRRRHHGRFASAALERLAAGAARRAVAGSAAVGPLAGPAAPEAAAASAIVLSPWSAGPPLWVEVSPRPLGFPAAAERLAAPPPGGWSLPTEVAERQVGALSVRLTDDGGRELARFTVQAPAPAAGAAGVA